MRPPQNKAENRQQKQQNAGKFMETEKLSTY